MSTSCHRRLPTERQLQIISLIACGIPDKSIASQLGISERAVRAQIERLLTMWDARTRAHLVALAIVEGCLSIDMMGSVATA